MTKEKFCEKKTWTDTDKIEKKKMYVERKKK